MYGSFINQLYDQVHYPLDCLDGKGPRHACVLAGPTCDSIDVIREDIPLPDLEIGDLLARRLMGACTQGAATDLNFIPRATMVALHDHGGRRRAD